MKFSTRHDTDLPPDRLFDLVSDFPRLEKLLMRRGASVRRIDPSAEPGVGMAWEVGFDWRGRRRDLRLDLTRFDRPETVALSGQGESFSLRFTMTVIALTRQKSRLMAELELRPQNMRARLILQTAKLGKTQLDQRYHKQVVRLIEDLAAA